MRRRARSKMNSYCEKILKMEQSRHRPKDYEVWARSQLGGKQQQAQPNALRFGDGVVYIRSLSVHMQNSWLFHTRLG